MKDIVKKIGKLNEEWYKKSLAAKALGNHNAIAESTGALDAINSVLKIITENIKNCSL